MNGSVEMALRPVEQHIKDCWRCRDGKGCDKRQNVIARNAVNLRNHEHDEEYAS